MTPAPFITHRLDNGLRVVLAPDSRVPIASLSLWYAVGSAHEASGRSGFAHLFEHMMFQGSAHVAKGQHFGLIEAAGGRTNAYTGLDATVFADTVPSHELELALWLEADRMATLGSALSQSTLDTQREVVKNERRKKVDNAPYGTWEERTFALAFPPEHPYHHSSWGSLAELSAASLDDVRAFFATHYLPNNAVLTLVGDFETDVALEMTAAHFGPIPAGPVPPRPNGLAASPVRRAGLREEVREALPLPRLYLGCVTPPLGDDGFDVADFVVDLLATGRSSRLRSRLVRELRLAQAVDAYTFPLVAGAGLLLIEATVRPKVAPGDLEAAIAEELEWLASRPLAEEELSRVRLMRDTRRGTTMQKAEERADRIGMYACLLDDPDRFRSEGERDAAIGAEDIRAYASRWLDGAHRSHVWFLPTDA